MESRKWEVGDSRAAGAETYAPHSPLPTPHSPQFLIIAPSWIGDTVAAQPLFMRLKQYHPDARIDVMAPPYVAAVLRRMPEVDGVLDNPFGHGALRIRERWRLGRQLAAKGYDAVYVLPNSLKSALVPFFARIPKRVGFKGEMRRGFLNVVHRLDKARLPLQVQRYAQLAETPGAPLPEPLPQPRLRVEPEAVRSTLAALGLAASSAPVVFCPGAEYGPAKRWPSAHFAALARLLAAEGRPVWLVGSKKDEAGGEEIAVASGGTALNLCGRTSLDQAIDLIAAAACVVTNDSGLMHVGAALDVPLLALFGSSSPGYTPPLSDRAKVLSLGLECSPCFKRECPLGHLKCLLDLTPERVWAEMNLVGRASARQDEMSG
ncbi:MAG: lipopolysaccharide heptosyltransferase II [Rhodocyclaceae bacterium]|nr:lipopolysaccharide heptosyltransferase II [Rhodocyclaceae bacterium]